MGGNWHEGEFSLIKREGWVWEDWTVQSQVWKNRNHLILTINFNSSQVIENLAGKNTKKLKYMENKPLELSHNYLDASRF